MILMSLDISTKSTGVAFFDTDTKELLHYECVAASSPNVYNRIEKITNRIEELVKEYKPEICISEEPEPAFVKNNIDVYRKLTFIHGAICLMLNHYKLTMELITSSAWRKKVGIKTGRGITRSVLKQEDVKKTKELFNLDVNDDIADAILMGYGKALETKKELNWE